MNETRDRETALLRGLTTFRVGGRPLLYLRPRGHTELKAALSRCRADRLPFRIMGGGSNVLADDGQLPFVVIHICSPGFDWIERNGATTLRVGAGVRLQRLLSYCLRAGLGGLEFLAGIPGTLGGALAGNAGAWDRSVGERLTRAWVLDETCRATRRPAGGIHFEYRSSDLGGQIITEGELKLENRSPERIHNSMAHYAWLKSQRHPTGVPSAGCIFKNPPEAAAAGELIEHCGLKGKRIGGAEISSLHANFICNVAGATSGDVTALIETARETVRREFHVTLELEVKRWQSEPQAA